LPLPLPFFFLWNSTSALVYARVKITVKESFKVTCPHHDSDCSETICLCVCLYLCLPFALIPVS
jgi:hypothetical protein